MSNRALDEANKYQRQAADPGINVFVTANAGSGKTKVLVDRIARLLLEGSKPSAFLCITYTKAAAAEMQSRLFDRLGKWCVADDEKLAAELKELGAPDANLSRARELFAQALETPGGLKIQTIHAFCERLLARFPLEAGVPPGFDIADEPRAAALLAAARADAALDHDAPKAAFERFAARRNGEQLELLLDRLAMKRGEFHRFSQKHMGAVFAETVIRNRHGVTKTAGAFTRQVLGDVDWEGLALAEHALAASTTNNQKTAARIKAARDVHASGDEAKTMDGLYAIVCTDGGKGAPYKDLATGKFCADNPHVEAILERVRGQVLEARDTLNAIERAEDAVAALQLAAKLDEAYEGAKLRTGALDFDDLIEHALALLQRSDAAPWVLYKLDGGLDHILIDEGQDTSPAQWTLIEPLQQEFFSGRDARPKPRTVFAVGDPKQSIYGFQGADPRRFLAENQALAKRAARAKQKFKGPELRTSFRSAPQILRAVDAVFADRELISGLPAAHDVIEHLAAREDDRGVVEVWPLAPRPERAEAQAWDAPMDVETESTAHAQLAKKIAARIKAMIDAREAVYDKDTRAPRPMHAGDVLALVRTRGALFRELIKAFKREGLPVAGADRMILRDELAVEDCLALMRVALDPADDLALACVLKGPWCEWSEEALFALAYGRGRQTLMQRLRESSAPEHAEARALVQAVCERAGEDAFAFLSWALETPHHGGATGWARVLNRLGAESRDPLEELLQRALKPHAFAAPTLQRFLSDIELDAGAVKRELEGESGAVRVMTVHGAKGLEAPVVILPDSTAPSNDKPDEGLIFDDEGEPFVSFSKSGDDDKTAAARTLHAERMLKEHWRLLYVAMTRARDRLIVCGAARGNSKAGESVEEGWRYAVEQALQTLGAEACDTPFGDGLRIGAPFTVDAPEQAEAPLPLALPAWATTVSSEQAAYASAAPSRLHRIDPALFSPRGDGQRRFRRGRLIHGLLERLPDIAPEQRHDAALTWLKRSGADDSEAEAYAAEALNVISDARFAAVFGPASRAEAPIVGEVAGRPISGVVDRLAVEADRVIVLDFKTDRPAPTDVALAPEPYVLQLALYRAVLAKIFPEKAISCALLWTEAPHLMAVPADRLDAALAGFPRG